MAQYKVRDGFFLHLGQDNVKEPGTVVELSPSQAEKYAHQIEPVVRNKPKSDEQVQS